MSLQSRRELLDSMRPRYRKSGKLEKGLMLDELMATCGYGRKYAIWLMQRPAGVKRVARGPRKRRAKYGPDVGEALLRLWKTSRGLCSKRLVAGLADLIDALERHNELSLPESLREKLLSLSASTADRLLGELRRSRGISTTMPGPWLLRSQIPIHTFADWQDAKPGYFEIDLVAHCGDTAAGTYAHTLTLTDVASGWTECVAIPNRGSMAVLCGLETVMERLPFGLLGIDSDNGTEFINAALVGFCEQRGVSFTRGRPYKKNDQCRVEQKNGAVVRPLVGYARYESSAAVDHINALYKAHRLYQNFFAPSAKLSGKVPGTTKPVKHYDTPKTPYARLLDYKVWGKDELERIQRFYRRLNPAAIGRKIDELEAGLRHHAVTRCDSQTQRTTVKGRLPDNLFGKKTK